MALDAVTTYAFPADARGVEVRGEQLFVGGADGTFRILDISDISSPVEVGILTGLDPASFIALHGNYAYVATDTPALRIVSILDPSNPQLLKTLPLSYAVTSLLVSGGHLYVSIGVGGMVIYDLADPVNPLVRSSGGTGENFLNVAVSGKRMYLADYTKRLKAMDVNDPAHPAYEGELILDTKTLNVRLDGAYSYTVCEGGKFWVAQFAWPSTTVMGACSIPGYASPPPGLIPVSMLVRNSYVLVAEQQNGLTVIDTNDQRHPAVVDSITLSGVPLTMVSNAHYAFVACGAQGVDVIDARAYLSGVRRQSQFNTPGITRGIKVRGAYVYAADGAGGFRIANFSNPTAPENVAVLTGIGEPWAVDVYENWAYVASRSGGVVVVNVAAPAAPAVVRTLSTPGIASDVFVNEGQTLLVADGLSGVRFYDLTTPNNPTFLTELDTPGTAVGVWASGNQAYVADYDGGVFSLDITNPAHPTIQGFLTFPGNVWDAKANGPYLYVAVEHSGLYVVDASNPAAMVTLGTCSTLDGSGSMSPYHAPFALDVAGNYALVGDGDGGLEVVDASNPAHPFVLDSYSSSTACWGVDIDGGYTFVGATHGGILAFNTTAYTSRLNMVAHLDSSGWGTTRGIRIRDNYLYQCEGGNGLRILDIADPHNPVLIGAIAPPSPGAWNVYAVDLYEHYAYLAAREVGILVMDVQNPANPVLVKTVTTFDAASDLQVSGARLYVADRAGGLQLYDLADPANPVYKSRFTAIGVPFSEFMGLDIVGNTVYIAGYWLGLIAIDYTNPMLPVQLGSIYLPPYALWDVKVDGEYAYVAGEGSGLIIIDISNPAAMSVVSRAVTPDGGFPPNDLPPFSIILRGHYAFLGDGPNGLQVVDIRDIRAPRVVDTLSLPGYTWGIGIRGNYVFTGSFIDGVYSVDASAYLAGVGGRVQVDSITPSQAWLFGGVKAQILGNGFRSSAVVSVADTEVEPIEVTPTSVFFIMPPLAHAGSGDEPFLDVDVTVMNASGGLDDADTTSFRFKRYATEGDVTATAFLVEHGTPIDLKFSDFGDAQLTVPAPLGGPSGSPLAYGIVLASKTPAALGTTAIDAGSGSSPISNIWDFSVHLYDTTIPDSAWNTEGLGSAVYDEYDAWTYAHGESVTPATLSFPTAGAALTVDDIRAGISLWSIDSRYDYETGLITFNTPPIATTYQSTLLSSETTPSAVPATPGGSPLDNVVVRVYDLSSFSLRQGQVTLPQDLCDAVYLDPTSPTHGPITGGTALRILAPKGGFGWVEAAFGDFVTGNEPASNFPLATVTNRGQSEYRIELETPAVSDGATVDIGIYLSSDLTRPVVVLNDAFTYLTDAATIVGHPFSQTVNPGTPVGFSVFAFGSEPLTYQWQKNGSDILGATSSSYFIFWTQESDEGQYRCIVRNPVGEDISNPATLTVNDPPAIITHPASQTIVAGSPVTFSVTATGSEPLWYQWFKNNNPILGAMSANYTISSVQSADAGTYFCIVTNTVTSAFSQSATLTVIAPPTITTQPISATVNPGTRATFSVAASGTPPLYYQWKKDDLPLPGATSTSLVIAAAQNANEGSYTCVVTNAGGSASSAPAVLSVNDPPNITQHPLSLTVNPGEPATFAVVVSGTSPFAYQWKKGTAMIAGATNASYTITNAKQTDEGNYSCVVSNIAGTQTSNAATLTVTDPPVITKQPASSTVNPGDSATFSVSATGTMPLGYQWRKGSNEIPGATNASLTLSNVKESDEGSYQCLVSNVAGSQLSNTAALTVNDPPTITQHPVSITVNAGSPAAFSVAATGIAPLSYQWKKGSADISGATSASYSISSAKESDAGEYSCIVSNPAGSRTSNTATLTVNVPPEITHNPEPKTVNPGAAVTFSVTATGTAPLSYQWKKGGGDISGATQASYTIAGVKESDEGSYSCAVSNIAGARLSTAAALVVNDPPAITQHPVSRTVNPGATVTFTASATGTAPLNYQWKKGSSDIVGATTASYTISNAKQSDEGNYSCVVSNIAGSQQSNVAALTVNDPPTITEHPTSRTVNPGVSTTFSVAATGTAPLNYQWKKGTSDVAGATSSSYTIQSVKETDEGNYSCVVSNTAGSQTSNTATLSVNDPPTVSTHPIGQTVNPGVAVSFTVVATGTQPLTYQWRKGSTDISGATSAVYSIASAAQSDEGAYTCVVTNMAGTQTSNTAVLTVNDPPQITAQPASKTVDPNAQVSFSVTATGTAPLTYQWKKGETDIVGAVFAIYTIASAQQSDEGAYKCVVTNVAGSTTSNVVTLTVNDPPVITSGPQPQTISAGTTASFSITATGTQPMTYQWHKDDVDIPGATTTVYSIAKAAKANEGQYSCTVSNRLGSQTSAKAALTVNCGAVTVPAGVQASDGSYTDRVRVVWSSVSGATAYKVFRTETAIPPTGDPIASVTATSFDDLGAKAPTVSGGSGCSGASETTYYHYFYWVKAVGECDNESNLSAPDEGWRGAAKRKAAETGDTVFAPVLPALFADAENRFALADSALFVRLRDAGQIEPESVWGRVSANGFESDEIEWRPVENGDASDGWAVYVPRQPWTIGDVITMTVGASTVSGKTVGPWTFTFRVMPEDPAATVGIPQPAYADSAALDDGETERTENIRVFEAMSDVIPPVNEARSAMYEIGPDQLFAKPQRVWIPLLPETRIETSQLYYFHGGESDGQWYAAERVEGWFEPDSYLEIEVDGIRYLGFVVRHGGIVQIGREAETTGQQVTSQASVIAFSSDLRARAGDVAILAIALIGLAIRRRTHPHEPKA